MCESQRVAEREGEKGRGEARPIEREQEGVRERKGGRSETRGRVREKERARGGRAREKVREGVRVGEECWFHLLIGFPLRAVIDCSGGALEGAGTGRGEDAITSQPCDFTHTSLHPYSHPGRQPFTFCFNMIFFFI